MALISTVPSTWIKDKNKRLEASFYNINGVKEANLYIRNKSIKKVPLRDLTINNTDGIRVPGRFKRIYVTNCKVGYKFITGSNIDCHDITTNCKYISRKHTQSVDAMLLKKESILVTRSGKIGKTAFVGILNEDIIGSDDLIRIIPDIKKISSGYLYAFLNTKIGQVLLCQNTYGSVIKHIEASHLYDLPVPRFNNNFEEKIHKLIVESNLCRIQSIDKLNSAKHITTKNLLPIGDEVRKYEVFYKKNNEVEFSFSAWNCSNIGNSIKQQINRMPNFLVGEFCTKVFSPLLFKHIYIDKDNGFPFITGGELEKENPFKERFLSPLGVKDINNYIVKKEWILVYKSGSIDGMIGSTYLVGEDLNGFCLSDHVIRLVIKEEYSSYTQWVFAFLKSKHGRLLLKQLATGSAIPFILPARLEKLKIPLPSNDEELLEVQSLVESSNSLRIKANELEKQAISMIEKEIG